MSTIVTLLLLVAVVSTLVHWHEDSPGQRCEICFARDLPGIHVPFAASVDGPTRVEWWPRIEKAVTVQSAFLHSKTSRAPPHAASI
jgi:hypothetical protein